MIAIVRGGGDLATGIIYRLWKVGFSVLCLEVEKPLVIRRTVSAASGFRRLLFSRGYAGQAHTKY